MGRSMRTRWFCCCILAMTLSTEFTLFGAAAIARQLVLPEELWMRRLSGGIVTFIPANINVTGGNTTEPE